MKLNALNIFLRELRELIEQDTRLELFLYTKK